MKDKYFPAHIFLSKQIYEFIFFQPSGKSGSVDELHPVCNPVKNSLIPFGRICNFARELA